MQEYGQQAGILGSAFSQALGANQQGFNQLSSAAGTSLGANQQQFSQLSNLSGLSQTNAPAAIGAMNQGNQNQAAAGAAVGQGIQGLGSSLSGLSSLFGPNATQTTDWSGLSGSIFGG